MDEMVNNWKAAKALDQFKALFVDPAEERYLDAKKQFDEYKWPNKELKEKGKHKLAVIETKMINLAMIYNSFKELIQQHEAQTDMLTEIYVQWYNNVSIEGKTPTEIMSMQADIMQKIWLRVYNAIQPLKLTLNPPSDGDTV
jgi:hypothetical protein